MATSFTPKNCRKMKKSPFLHKVCVVTGSTQGIGEAIAQALLAQGAQVVINGRNPERLAAAQARFVAQGYQPLALPGDVTDWDQMSGLMRQVVARYGGIDFVIANAGVSAQGAFGETQPEVFRHIMDTNMLGCIYPTLAALPHLLARRGGVLFIGSIAGLYGLPYGGIYAMTKMSLRALVESLRVEYGAQGLSASLLYVGLTENDPGKGLLGPDGRLRPAPDRQVPRQPKAVVAQHALAMLRQRQAFRVLTPLGRALGFLARWAPWAVRAIMRRQMRQFQHGAVVTPASPPQVGSPA